MSSESETTPFKGVLYLGLDWYLSSNLTYEAMDSTFSISDFIILTTGSDNGHRYVETHITRRGQQRRMTVFFASKLDEAKLELHKPFKVQGIIQDDGEQYGLILREAKIWE